MKITKVLSYLKFWVNLQKEKQFIKRQYKLIYGGNNKIFKRLHKSSYQLNDNDFVFLKPPFSKKEIPCDYKIVNFIKFLWKNGFITFGSNEADDDIDEFGYITFALRTSSGKDTNTELKNLFLSSNLFLNLKICSRDQFLTLIFDELTLRDIHTTLNLQNKVKENLILGYTNCVRRMLKKKKKNKNVNKF